MLQLQGDMGLCVMGNIFPGGEFISQNDTSLAAHRTPLKIFAYLQLRAAVKDLYLTFPSEPPTHNALQILLSPPTRQRLVTNLYNAAQREQFREREQALQRWEDTLGSPISKEDWGNSCTLTQMLTLNCNLRIIHFKFLQQVYYTPAQLHKYGLREDDRCARCSAQQTDCLHMAWACPHIQSYWQTVTSTLTEMLAEQIPNSPQVCLLGIYKIKQIRRRKFLAVALLLAKRRVALKWGSRQTPKSKNWITDMTYCKEQLENYAEEIPEASRPKDFWDPLMQYRRSMQPDV